MISYKFLLLQHFSNHKHPQIIESDELITTLMKIFLHNIFSFEIKLLEPQFLNLINTYHIQFGARTSSANWIKIVYCISETLTLNKNIELTTRTDHVWLISIWKVWQISLTTEHNCLSFIFIFILSVPILEDMFKLNLFLLHLSALTEIRNYKSTSFQDL